MNIDRDVLWEAIYTPLECLDIMDYLNIPFTHKSASQAEIL